MINHIDVSVVLRGAVCDLYSNLVTRPTGIAVRTQIEQMLSELPAPTLSVIDFSNVLLLDYSCADEVVAKLLLRNGAESGHEAYFLFRGISDSHLEAIEQVLERHGLALVAVLDDGAPTLLGRVDDGERRVWETVYTLGCIGAAELASAVGAAPEDAASALERLRARRLVMLLDGGYVALGHAV